MDAIALLHPSQTLKTPVLLSDPLLALSSLLQSMAESFAFDFANKVLGKIASLALQEVALAWGVTADLDGLKDTLSVIQAVISDAEEQQSNSRQITDWLLKLKKALYEAEDVLDDFEYEALRRRVAKAGSITKQLKYPAPGAPELAKRVKELLMASNFKSVKEDKKRGLDHGAWVPLMLMYPEADIPVCQLSVQTNRDGSYHYNMGRALAPLREEGVLIIGSGSATHNLRALDPNSESVVPWAYEFDTWLKEALLDGRYEDINHYEEKAPHAREAHPWPEHFYPLHVAMGAAGENAKAKLIHHSWSLGTLSYASYQFTTTAT